MEQKQIVIGNVLRADIRSFVVASRIPEPEVPTFGTFVRAPIQQGQTDLIGLVYNISLQDDPFLRNLAITIDEAAPEDQEIIRDQQENRTIPVEISVAAVGYRYRDVEPPHFYYGLPPQPPMILHRITVCSKAEVIQIAGELDFMEPLLANRDVPADELIPTTLLRAVRLFPEEQREPLLLAAGRYLARYLGRDPLRLEKILRRLSR